eukprot:PhF_6_TR26294/c4_g1_i1/m.37698/K12591/RRP6, EXOSC10; exosome complex exonuclease RRP6
MAESVHDKESLLEYLHEMFQQLGNVKKSSEALPSDDDYDFCTAFPEFLPQIHNNSRRLLTLMHQLTQHSGGDVIPDQYPIRSQAAFQSTVANAMKRMLESIDVLIDEATGEKMNAAEQNAVRLEGAQDNAVFVVASSGVLRPVLDPAPDNTNELFRPLLWNEDGSSWSRGAPSQHPYAEVIQEWIIPGAQMRPVNEKLYEPVQSTPLRMITTRAQLQQLVDDLKSVSEFAVDLEHHSLHSYLGVTCLVQISTRTTDYIIDALAVRRHMHLLREAFLSPTIVKVFHGANEDIKWLQMDFGIYVCNMFDTGIALQALHHPHGLAHLLKHFCNVTPDKRYQLADWRLRPLTDAMVEYARGDTHYLLYCYDRLRNVLLDPVHSVSVLGNLLKYVWEQSRAVCLTTAEKEVVTKESCDIVLGRYVQDMSYQQVAVARAVYQWRDAIARVQDESTTIIMSNASVVRIAHALPLDAESVQRYCVPLSRVVQKNLDSLVSCIRSALENANPEDVPSRRLRGGNEGGSGGVRGAPIEVCHGVHVPLSGTLPSIEASYHQDDQHQQQQQHQQHRNVATHPFQPPVAHNHISMNMPNQMNMQIHPLQHHQPIISHQQHQHHQHQHQHITAGPYPVGQAPLITSAGPPTMMYQMDTTQHHVYPMYSQPQPQPVAGHHQGVQYMGVQPHQFYQ